jgi:ribosomal protein S18 acetylase RimI-like enzyme
MAASPDQFRDVVIRRWTEIPDRHRLMPEFDAIFFEASNTKAFAGEAERCAFRERWLGKYLAKEPQFAYVALAGAQKLAGYLVGSLSEPVGFEAFANAAWEYPAHLHVNLAPQFRNRGIGARLIGAFASDALLAGAPGMHVVTSSDSRNVGFYTRNGFAEVARTSVDGRELVFLGRKLGVAETA